MSFILDESDRKNTLPQEEQRALKFIAQTGRNMEDVHAEHDENERSGKAPDGYLHFRQHDLLVLHLKGIQAERIWRSWLKGGKKGPATVTSEVV